MAIDTFGKPNFDNINPNFSITIDGQAVSKSLTDLVRSIEYESVDNMADMAKIVFANPNFILSDVKGLQPGHEIFIEMGYGNQISPIGRVQIVRHHPTFPRSGMPTIEVIGYTADYRMMDHTSSTDAQKKREKQIKDLRQDVASARAVAKKAAAEAIKAGQDKKLARAQLAKKNRALTVAEQKITSSIYTNVPYSQAVEQKCINEYGFVPQVDPTKGIIKDFFQPAKMSDYDFIRALANITGYFFWVDGDAAGKWTLHFKEPGSENYLQDKQYTFEYNAGDASSLSTLLEFRPELLIKGQKTKVQAQYRDTKTGKVVRVEFPEEPEKDGPDVFGSDIDIRAIQQKAQDAVLGEEYTSAVPIKLFINDFAFEAMAPRRVKSAEALKIWAEQWYRENKQNFIMCNGSVIGLETLLARQTHELAGIGDGFGGLYYFSRVRHRMDSTGYECEFDARKVVE